MGVSKTRVAWSLLSDKVLGAHLILNTGRKFQYYHSKTDEKPSVGNYKRLH